jgi:NTP pyrophosphatase (non-canonical NTP hydrolase)
MAMGLSAEVGEFVGLIDKQLFKPSKLVTRDMLIDELSDVWYYVVIGSYLLGITLDELEEYNKNKLSDGHGWVKKI